MANKHAKLMIEYAKDWAETGIPWIKWEFMTSYGKWSECTAHPVWSEGTEYRRKPRTININGIEVPEPVREPLEDGEEYFYPYITSVSKVVHESSFWDRDVFDRIRLQRGIIHRTKEAAIQHAKALLSFTQVEGEQP